MPALADITRYLDDLLRIADIPDYPNALNGLQVETDQPIVRLAAAVDARERTIREAADAGASLLLVHHGLFWNGVEPLRGRTRRRIEALITSRLGVYSAHLPLDAHPELGNNVLLARALGLEPTNGFARYRTIDIGVSGESDVATTELVARVETFARGYDGTTRVSFFPSSQRTRRWAICTGAGASHDTLAEAARRGIDTLIVGEGPHWSAIDAEELGITLVYAGHYATETLGVRALADHLSRRFDIPWTFVHVPTGL